MDMGVCDSILALCVFVSPCGLVACPVLLAQRNELVSRYCSDMGYSHGVYMALEDEPVVCYGNYGEGK